MTTYVPILKSKLAEYWAWGNASQAIVASSRVLFELVPGADGIVFAGRIARAWPAGAVLTVDCGHLNGAVLQVARELQQRHVPSRPVMRLDDSPTVLGEIASAAALHREGACLRLGSVDSDPDPVAAAAALPRVLSATGLGTPQIDLLLDYGVVASPRDVTRCVPVATAAIAWAASSGPWRSVTLASGSFPTSISSLALGAATPLRRYDAALFAAVYSAGPALEIDYGDYGINHPRMPVPVPRGPKPNLRYASNADWQVYREDTVLPGHQSFFTLCGRLVNSAHWAGANYSAGDREVERCSRGVGGAGRATEWLAYSTSHHLAHMVDRLANLGVP